MYVHRNVPSNVGLVKRVIRSNSKKISKRDEKTTTTWSESVWCYKTEPVNKRRKQRTEPPRQRGKQRRRSYKKITNDHIDEDDDAAAENTNTVHVGWYKGIIITATTTMRLQNGWMVENKIMMVFVWFPSLLFSALSTVCLTGCYVDRSLLRLTVCLWFSCTFLWLVLLAVCWCWQHVLTWFLSVCQFRAQSVCMPACWWRL